MGFDLASALNLRTPATVSKMDTTMQMIDLALIDPHPDNFFPVEADITDLAESIELNGLCQPLIVSPQPDGRYRVIAGHRRRAALLQLAEKDPEKWKSVCCNVQHPASPEMEMLMLIQTNTESREIGWSVKEKASTIVEGILVKLQKKQGVILPGKMRAHVAKILKTSESQLARAKYISDHLIPEAKKMHLNDSAAYKLAHMPEKDQKALVHHYKGHSWQLDTAHIKLYEDNIAAGKSPFYVEPYVRTCYEEKGYPKCKIHDFFAQHKEKCGSHDCCSYCPKRFDCQDLCPTLRKKIAAHKESFNYKLGQAIKASTLSLSDKDVAGMLNTGAGTLNDIENGVVHITCESLFSLCSKMNLSADALMGLPQPVNSPSENTGADTQKWRKLYIDGKPEMDQVCFCLVNDQRIPDNNICSVWLALWDGSGFVSAINGKTRTKNTILGWLPACDPPEGYTFSVTGGDADG